MEVSYIDMARGKSMFAKERGLSIFMFVEGG